jgi:hypothetical protein
LYFVVGVFCAFFVRRFTRYDTNNNNEAHNIVALCSTNYTNGVPCVLPRAVIIWLRSGNINVTFVWDSLGHLL